MSLSSASRSVPPSFHFAPLLTALALLVCAAGLASCSPPAKRSKVVPSTVQSGSAPSGTSNLTDSASSVDLLVVANGAPAQTNNNNNTSVVAVQPDALVPEEERRIVRHVAKRNGGTATKSVTAAVPFVFDAPFPFATRGKRRAISAISQLSGPLRKRAKKSQRVGVGSVVFDPLDYDHTCFFGASRDTYLAAPRTNTRVQFDMNRVLVRTIPSFMSYIRADPALLRHVEHQALLETSGMVEETRRNCSRGAACQAFYAALWERKQDALKASTRGMVYAQARIERTNSNRDAASDAAKAGLVLVKARIERTISDRDAASDALEKKVEDELVDVELGEEEEQQGATTSESLAVAEVSTAAPAEASGALPAAYAMYYAEYEARMAAKAAVNVELEEETADFDASSDDLVDEEVDELVDVDFSTGDVLEEDKEEEQQGAIAESTDLVVANPTTSFGSSADARAVVLPTTCVESTLSGSSGRAKPQSSQARAALKARKNLRRVRNLMDKRKSLRRSYLLHYPRIVEETAEELEVVGPVPATTPTPPVIASGAGPSRKRRLLRELESSLDGNYWAVVGTGRTRRAPDVF